MSGPVYQLTPISCNQCGMGNIHPRESNYYDRYSKETVTEATWVCHRCGNVINRGEISRTKDSDTE